MARKVTKVAGNEKGKKTHNQFGQRQNFKRGASVMWIRENAPAVWDAISAEADRRFPVTFANRGGRKTQVNYKFLEKVKVGKAKAAGA